LTLIYNDLAPRLCLAEDNSVAHPDPRRDTLVAQEDLLRKSADFGKFAVRAAIPQRLLKTNKFVIADSAVRVSFIADDQAA